MAKVTNVVIGLLAVQLILVTLQIISNEKIQGFLSQRKKKTIDNERKNNFQVNIHDNTPYKQNEWEGKFQIEDEMTRLDTGVEIRNAIASWWRCADLSALYRNIADLESETFDNPSKSHRRRNRRSRRRRRAGKSFALTPELEMIHTYITNVAKKEHPSSQEVRVLKMERWFDQWGSHGLADLAYLQDSEWNTMVYEFGFNDAQLFVNKQWRPLSPETHTTHFVIALRDTEVRLFDQWIDSIRVVAAEETSNIEICAALFTSNKQGYDAVRSTLENSGVRFSFLASTAQYSKALGIQNCINTIHDNDAIVFVSEVDVEMPTESIPKAMRYLVRGRRFYSPVVYVHAPDRVQMVEKDVSFGWDTNSVDVYAAFLSDLNRLGGYDLEKLPENKLFQDVDVFFRLRSGGLQVVRKKERQFRRQLRNDNEKLESSPTSWTSNSLDCSDFK
eukprot:gb/GECH01014427.1/.p1 GENE.gb/GECH01014427.1/~~gb/GECH01014427.1/.p1  ORF type:complete len:446 (+),score=96.18 gb/GECH01014427.1/:1-1338(+)